MNPQDRIKSWKLHESQRGYFGFALYKLMAEDERIWLLTGDLGYGLFDHHQEDFSSRYLNVGASEQVLVGAGIGLALQGKIPFLYSITPFLLYRPFEWLRNYVHHESISVKLIGSGLEKDYAHDGFTHQPTDVIEVLDCLPNIKTFWPQNKEDAAGFVPILASNQQPSFMALRR